MDNDEAPTTLEPRSRRKRGIGIREMEIDDLAPVFHLGERLFTATRWPNLYRTWDEFEVIGLFGSDSRLCLVAEQEDQMVGFALGTTIAKTGSAWKYGHLVWLGVEPWVQRLGVGEKLFHHLVELMEEDGVRIVLVDTAADNHAALRFFRGLGFGKPEDHVYLSLNLAERRRRGFGPIGGRKETAPTR